MLEREGSRDEHLDLHRYGRHRHRGGRPRSPSGGGSEIELTPRVRGRSRRLIPCPAAMGSLIKKRRKRMRKKKHKKLLKKTRWQRRQQGK